MRLEKFTKSVLYLSASALLVMLSVLVWQTCLLVRVLPDRLDAAIDRQTTRLLSEVRDTRQDLIAQIGQFRSDLRGELRGTRKDLDKRLESITLLLDSRLDRISTQLIESLNAQLTRTNDNVENVLRDTSVLLKDADKMVQVVTPQVLGATAAFKVTAGDIAKMARTWEKNTPQITQNVVQATENVKQATKLSKFQKLLIALGAVAAVVSAIF